MKSGQAGIVFNASCSVCSIRDRSQRSRLPVGGPERRPGCVPQYCYRPALMVRQAIVEERVRYRAITTIPDTFCASDFTPFAASLTPQAPPRESCGTAPKTFRQEELAPEELRKRVDFSCYLNSRRGAIIAFCGRSRPYTPRFEPCASPTRGK